MGLSRRALIKQAGAAIAAMGLTELALNMEGIPTQAKAYTQAFALGQSSGRKLALLVGVNKYAAGALTGEQTGQLLGCMTDVLLQKEVLIHRFGFLPQDIVCLTNEQATRNGIYQAFVNHLYSQAKAGDVVVFHFSGYGAQVRIEGGDQQQTVRSLVPFDGLLPTESRPALNDILEVELKTLLKQLKTKKVTTVLDAGFADIPVPLSGGLRSRTRSAIATGQMPTAFPLLTGQTLGKEDAAFPGVLLRGADPAESVIERQWNGFSAGAFTYVLTQYIWTTPEPITVGQALARSQEKLLRWGGSNQQPTASGSLDLRNLEKTPPPYNTPVIEDTRGIGAVQSVNLGSQTASLWLGGLPPRVLEYLGPTSVITCGDQRLKLRSRDGLTAVARLTNAASSSTSLAGLPVLESIRVLPKKVDLIVALDSQLERIERVDATSALSGLSFISSTSDTGLPADCLLAKPIAESSGTLTASLQGASLAKTRTAQASSKSSSKSSSKASSKELEPAPTDDQSSLGYGLFSLTRSLIPGTLSLQEEAIKPAISRLMPKLQSLLALKLLRLSENRASSQLPVRVSLEMVSPEEKQLISRQTFESGPQTSPKYKRAPSPEGFIPQVPIGSRVRYRLYNDSRQPLYYTLINVDPRERLSAFCPVMGLSAQPAPSNPDASNEAANNVIAAASIIPGGSVAVPSVDLDWSVEAPTGPIETYVVCSTSPLTNTFRRLLAVAASSGNQRISPLLNPLEVVEALLSDISTGKNDDVYSLDATQWATLNFTYQAV